MPHLEAKSMLPPPSPHPLPEQPGIIRIPPSFIMAFLRGRSIYCITSEEINTNKRIAFSSVCITTATISSFGAIVQLVNWYKKLRVTRSEARRVPSSTPHIVFSLALADLFTCVGKHDHVLDN